MTKRRTILAAALIAPAAALAFTVGGAGGLDDTAQVKQASKDFASAWNKKDAKAIGNLFSRDGDMVCPDGKVETGSSAVEGFFSKEFAEGGPMKKCNLEITKENVRFITPDVALSDLDCTMTGMTKPDGTEAAGPMTNHVVVISKKEGGQWKIAAARPGIPLTEEMRQKMEDYREKGEKPMKKPGE
jgi:uncharacterized protein (TIGR02246 family)